MIPIYRYEDLDEDGLLTHGANRLHFIASGSDPDDSPCRVELQQTGRDTTLSLLATHLASETITEFDWEDE